MTAQQQSVPEWVATLVGSLVLEGEAMRRRLVELERQNPSPSGPRDGDTAD